MSRNLSLCREAEVLGFDFIDPLDSAYPLKKEPTYPEPVSYDEDTAPISETIVPIPKIVPVDNKATWIQSKNGFFQTVLSNGLRVILYQTSAQPVVQCQTVYHFGSNDEIGANERGLAHICEHMIFKGTKNKSPLYLSETDIPAISRMLGANYNAFTSTNITSYHFNSCPEYTEGFLRILAASMFDTKLEEQHLRSEKLAVLAEMKHGKDSIFRDALINIRQNMYDEKFPQYWPTIGNIEDISNLKSDTLQSFYNRLYHPRNATLFVVGDMSDKQLTQFKTTTIESLFATDVSIENAGAPVKIDAMCNGQKKIGSSLKRVFHTLAKTENFMLISFPLDGMGNDIHSKKAFGAIDSIMFDGQESRLYKALVTKGHLGVTSIGGFVQLDKDFSEYHIVVQGTSKIQENEQTIKDTVMHAFLKPISETELKKCQNSLAFSTANTRTNIGSLVSSWIEDFNLTKDPNTYWNTSEQWMESTKKRMLEIQQTYANNHSWSVSYRACNKEEAHEITEKMSASHLLYKTRLKDDEHRRTTALEPPAALVTFKNWVSRLKCEAPTIPIVSVQNHWKYISSPDFQLVKVAVRPVQRNLLHTSSDGDKLSFVSEIMGEVFPQEQFKLDGLRGAFSGSLAVVASYADHINMRCSSFSSWLDRYASTIEINDQAKIAEYYDNNKEKFLTKWKESNLSRNISAEENVFEKIRQNCSDEYYVTQFSNKFEQVQHTINTFDITDALQTWNKYWSSTQQIMTHHEPTECNFDPNYQPESVQHLDPIQFVRKDFETVGLQMNPDAPLNQSIVAIARPGQLTKKNIDYWTVRSIANVIQFHSLGSRLFKLRESKGLFYSASGSFSSGSTMKCVGYDFILAKVDPGNEDFMITQLKKFSTSKEGMLKPVTPNELIAAKRIVINNWRKMNTESKIVSHWSQHADYFDDIAMLPNNMLLHIDEVTAEQVDTFIRNGSDVLFDFSVKCS